MILPILALCLSATRCFGGLLGVRVHWKRNVLVNERNLAFVFGLELLQRRLNLLTIRALIVCVFDQQDRRIRYTAKRSVLDRYRNSRRSNTDGYFCLSL